LQEPLQSIVAVPLAIAWVTSIGSLEKTVLPVHNDIIHCFTHRCCCIWITSSQTFKHNLPLLLSNCGFLKKVNRDQRQCKDTYALKSDRRLWRKGTILVPNAIGVVEELSFLSLVIPLPIQTRHSIHHSRCKIKVRLNESWSMRYAADPAPSSKLHGWDNHWRLTNKAHSQLCVASVGFTSNCSLFQWLLLPCAIVVQAYLLDLQGDMEVTGGQVSAAETSFWSLVRFGRKLMGTSQLASSLILPSQGASIPVLWILL
jgi:hypothetical protein